MNKKSEYVLPMQPFLRSHVGQSNFYSINEDAISQVYDFTIEKGQKIDVTGVPDACVDIQIYESLDHKEKGIRVIGPNKKICPSYIEFEDNYHYFGFILKSGYPVEIDGNPTAKLFDKILKLDDYNRSLSDIFDIITCTSKVEDKMEYAHKLLLEHIQERDSEKDMVCRYLVEYMLQHKGELKLEDLAREVGYTPYYTNKVFCEITGQPIKRYYNTMRFQRVLNAFNSYAKQHDEKPDYSAWANDFGYSDQSHLINHFKQCSGMTPHYYWKYILQNSFFFFNIFILSCVIVLI